MGNHLTRIDGNGIFLSNYNRNATIASNEMSWVGDGAIAAWGSVCPLPSRFPPVCNTTQAAELKRTLVLLSDGQVHERQLHTEAGVRRRP